MDHTPPGSPPPPYSSFPPSILGSRACSVSPPPYRTSPSIPFKPTRAATAAPTDARGERAPLLGRSSRRQTNQLRNTRRGIPGPIQVEVSPKRGLPPGRVVVHVVFVLLFLSLTVGMIFRLHSYYSSVSEIPVPTYSVAIVGGGPAGIAAAWHIRNLSTSRGVKFNITLYESKPIIGGILALHDANGEAVLTKGDPMQGPITAEDIAGKALMWNNKLFTRDSEHALKDEVNFIELGPERVGYYDGEHKTASSVRPYKKMPTSTWLGLIWSYWSSVWQADKLAQEGQLDISKARLVPNVEDIFRSLGVLNFLRLPADAVVKSHGISERYATEILEPQVQRAYGQGLNQVTGLAAMLATAQEESANVYMGGDLIERLQRIVYGIDLDVRTSTHVTGIKPIETDKKQPAWLIQHENAEGGNGNLSAEVFGKVIMATSNTQVRIENCDGVALNLTSYYENDVDAADAAILDGAPFLSVHVTFFTTETKLSSWDGEDQVLFLDAKKAGGIREIALVREIVNIRDTTTELEYLYRVFSTSPVLEKLQDHANISWSYETTIDQAYPVLFPLRVSFPPFALPWAKGFWWTSIIHRAGTTIDLNWLAGKAVAEALVKEVAS
ncbi:hypothetical protein F4861DRAFT_490541 [Xylaria intraflava]|nr:hypothetical protein F4861DRAFT_490541 [Xylaria intraflava]